LYQDDLPDSGLWAGMLRKAYLVENMAIMARKPLLLAVMRNQPSPKPRSAIFLTFTQVWLGWLSLAFLLLSPQLVFGDTRAPTGITVFQAGTLLMLSSMAHFSMAISPT
jgi:hypothetical protein